MYLQKERLVYIMPDVLLLYKGINMDMNVLPEDIKFANLNQRNYVKKATIAEICRKYQTYERCRKQPHMKHVIKGLCNVLEILHDKGYVTRIKNPNSDWNHYFVNVDSIVDMNQNLINEKHEPVNTKEAEIVNAKKDNTSDVIKFDVSDSKLTGINLICAIADKYRNLAFNARTRGIKFDLSLEDVEQIILAKHCYYSNVEFDGVIIS